MLYRLEERIRGTWQLLREITDWGSWDEIASRGTGSFRLVESKSGDVVRELHLR